MRFINTKIHGVLDYLFGVILLIAPWIFGFSSNITAMWISISCGIGILVYSEITRYELSHWKLMPINVHLWFDGILGLLLLSAPWFFGFAKEVVTPFVLLGMIAIVVPLLSKTHMANEPPSEPEEYNPDHEYEVKYGAKWHAFDSAKSLARAK